MKRLVMPDEHDLCIRTFLTEIDALDPVANKRGVLHIGAHMGEEVQAYLDHRYATIHLVEANPEILPPLTVKFAKTRAVHVLPMAIGDTDGEIEFVVHRTAKGSMESAGILPLGRLGQIVPVFNSDSRYVVPMTTVDNLAQSHQLLDGIDLMVLDIQGAELRALSGATRMLQKVGFVICEVNLISNYVGCALEPEIDAVMLAAGFTKRMAIYHELYDHNGRFPAWGECLWQRQ